MTFHGTVLDPTTVQLNKINQIIEDFVTHKIVISKERIYLPVNKGGLGMVNTESFLAAQKCSWIRRCFNKINDVWRWDFLRLTNYSLSMVRFESFDKNLNPMLWNIVNAVCKFQLEYWKKMRTFWKRLYLITIFFYVRNRDRGRLYLDVLSGPT